MIKKKSKLDPLKLFNVVFPIENKKPQIKKWNELTKTPKMDYSTAKGLAARTGEINDFWCLDIDLKNLDTDASSDEMRVMLTKLIKNLRSANIPYQKTPGNGYHFFFKYQKNIPNRRGNYKAGEPPVDLLADGSCVQYCGEGYSKIYHYDGTDNLRTLENLLTTNSEIAELLADLYIFGDKKNHLRNPHESEPGDDNITKYSVDDIRNFLKWEDNRDYLPWFRALSKCKTQFYLHEESPEIYAIFDEWSKEEPDKYNRKNNKTIWDNLKDPKLNFSVPKSKTKDLLTAIKYGQQGIADFYYSLKKDDIVLFSESEIYKYNTDLKIWQDSTKNDIISDLSNTVTKEMDKLLEVCRKKKDYDHELKLLLLLKSTTTATNLSGAFVHLASDRCFKRRKEDVKLNDIRHIISFRNGVYDFKDNQFRERRREDMQTIYLNYDYSPNVPTQISDKIKKILTNICNDDERYLDFMYRWLGYCLTGETGQQKLLFVIGHTASNGKTTISHIFNLAFEEYCKKIDRQTFNMNYTKAHKQLSGIKYKRYIYVEELERTSLNVELLKDMVDGKNIENEVMYGTSENITLYCKLNLISNHDPIFKSDEGIRRRGLCMVLKNRFVEKHKYEDGISGLYLLDENLIKMFGKDEYKNAFINLLIPYAVKYYKEGLEIPDQIRNQFDEIVNENDEMEDFLNNYCEITKIDEDRILKNDFVDLYNSANKTKHKFQFLLSDLKKKGIEYDRKKPKNNIQGCFL